MINIHLNGDIVRSPDISGLYAKRQQTYEIKKVCKYGYKESECAAWCDLQKESLNKSNFENIKNINTGRCSLAGSTRCPAHLLRLQTGKQKKQFEINTQVYRKVASCGHLLVKESKSKTIFITLTFPQWKTKRGTIANHKYTKKIFEDEILNKYFSRFMENMVKNYGCEHYIAVREHGEVGGRIHYHLLMSIPFHRFSTLNSVWVHTIQDICFDSINAVSSRKKRVIVYDPIAALKYICKYVAKTKGQKSDCRTLFISHGLLSYKNKVYYEDEEIQPTKGLKVKRCSKIQKPMREDTESVLDSFGFDFMRRTSDYTTLYRITDEQEFRRFCKEFLYPFFELSDKKSKFFTANPLSSS